MIPYLAYVIPFAVALAVAASWRVFGGVERAARWAGTGVALGFLAGWQVLVGPDWVPKSAPDRIGHIALGALLLGIVLDGWPSRALVRYALVGAYVAGCAILSAFDGLPRARLPELPSTIAAGALAAAWLASFARLSLIREDTRSVLTIATMALAGVAVVALIAGLGVPAKAALAAASAVLGYSLWLRISGTTLSWTVLLLALAVVFGSGWSVWVATPAAAPGLALLLFLLFADRTARRVPMPGGRISDALYVLVLIAISALPVLLAALVAAARLAC
jgi:hypothetical protein